MLAERNVPWCIFGIQHDKDHNMSEPDLKPIPTRVKPIWGMQRPAWYGQKFTSNAMNFSPIDRQTDRLTDRH